MTLGLDLFTVMADIMLATGSEKGMYLIEA
jgi:hypothetical protein